MCVVGQPLYTCLIRHLASATEVHTLLVMSCYSANGYCSADTCKGQLLLLSKGQSALTETTLASCPSPAVAHALWPDALLLRMQYQGLMMH